MTTTTTDYGTICDECGQPTICHAQLLTDDRQPSGLFLCNDCIAADELYQARRIELARTIKQWREDIAIQTDRDSQTALLCYCHNYATHPSKLHTDEESRALGKLARACRRQLARRSFWFESDSGRYVPAADRR